MLTKTLKFAGNLAVKTQFSIEEEGVLAYLESAYLNLNMSYV